MSDPLPLNDPGEFGSEMARPLPLAILNTQLADPKTTPLVAKTVSVETLLLVSLFANVPLLNATEMICWLLAFRSNFPPDSTNGTLAASSRKLFGSVHMTVPAALTVRAPALEPTQL